MSIYNYWLSGFVDNIDPCCWCVLSIYTIHKAHESRLGANWYNSGESLTLKNS